MNNAQAQSLQDALQQGTVSGGLSLRYIDSGRVSAGLAQSNASIHHNKQTASAAITLNYISGDYHGFKLAAGFQHGQDYKRHNSEGGPPWASEDDYRNSIDSTNLQRFFVDYSVNNTQIRLGRQQILFTPLLSNSAMFPMQDAFDAITVINKDIENTSIKFFGVQQWVKRYGSDSDGSLIQNDYQFDDGLWSVWASSQLSDHLKLEGQYLTFNAPHSDNIGDPPINTPLGISGGRSQWFFSAAYTLPTAYPLTVEGKYLGVDYDPPEEKDSSIVGLKLGTKINGFGLKLAYEAVDDDNSYAGTIGHVPMFGTYSGAPFIITDALFAGMSSISAALSHNLGVTGLKSTLNYARFNHSREGVANGNGEDFDGASELLFDISYRFQQVRGLTARAMLAYMDYDVESAADDSLTYTRLFLDYKF